MKKIPLSQNKFALVDDELFDELNQYTWFCQESRNTFYALRNIRKNGKNSTLRMHRQIFNFPSSDKVIDHKDGNGLNNQRENIRIASYSENSINRRKPSNSISSYKGIGWDKDKRLWRVDINLSDRRIYIGRFKNELTAAAHYDLAAKKYYGEFAYLNFPPKSIKNNGKN